MGYFRFRRSIKIAPGVRWNIGKKGSSISVGGHGITHTIGPKGSRTTIGIPGTGVSYTHIHSSTTKSGQTSPPPAVPSVTGSAAPPNSQPQSTRSRSLYVLGIILLGIWLLNKLAEQNSPAPTTAHSSPPTSTPRATATPFYSEATPRSSTSLFPPLPSYSPSAARSETPILRATAVEATQRAAQAATPMQTPGASPVQTASVYPTVSPSASPLLTPTYKVVGVRAGDFLSLRGGPGSSYPLIARIPPSMRGILSAGTRAENGSTIWQQISVRGYTGWVNKDYLEEERVRGH